MNLQVRTLLLTQKPSMLLQWAPRQHFTSGTQIYEGATWKYYRSISMWAQFSWTWISSFNISTNQTSQPRNWFYWSFWQPMLFSGIYIQLFILLNCHLRMCMYHIANGQERESCSPAKSLGNICPILEMAAAINLHHGLFAEHHCITIWYDSALVDGPCVLYKSRLVSYFNFCNWYWGPPVPQTVLRRSLFLISGDKHSQVSDYCLSETRTVS